MIMIKAGVKKQNRWGKLLITLLLVSVLLSAAFFFRVRVLNKNIIYVLQFGIIIVMIVLLLFQQVYWRLKVRIHYFVFPVLCLLFGVFLSMYTAFSEHAQPFGVSIWANRYLYYFLFYFLLHLLFVSPKELERLIFIIGVIYALAFLVQYLLYPTMLFDVRMGIERGTIRIFIPGLAFLNLAYFIALQRVLYKNSLMYLGFMVLFLIVYLLTGTRSIIAGPAVVTLVALIISKRVKSRWGMFVLVLLATIVAFSLFQDIVINLIQVSEAQSMETGENIRVKAARFFLVDFFPNKWAYIAGNSEAHQASAYGMEIFTYKMRNGFYQSDIGFLGEFSKYGLFLLVSAISMFWIGFRCPVTDEYRYTRYFWLLTLLTLPLGSSFTTPDFIVSICVVMYLFDREKSRLQPGREKQRSKPAVYFPELDKA